MPLLEPGPRTVDGYDFTVTEEDAAEATAIVERLNAAEWEEREQAENELFRFLLIRFPAPTADLTLPRARALADEIAGADDLNLEARWRVNLIRDQVTQLATLDDQLDRHRDDLRSLRADRALAMELGPGPARAVIVATLDQRIADTEASLERAVSASQDVREAAARPPSGLQAMGDWRGRIVSGMAEMRSERDRGHDR